MARVVHVFVAARAGGRDHARAAPLGPRRDGGGRGDGGRAPHLGRGGRGPEREPLAELELAQLDLPPALLAALARSSLPGPCVERLERIPGIHYVLVAPLADGTVLTVGIGPRTRLLPPNRVARFLRGDPGIEPPYTILLSLPVQSSAVGTTVAWRREGWTARGERQVDLPGGGRHVHLRLPLGGPWGLLVRAILVVGLDVALLACVWLFGLIVVEGMG